jgi:DNA-binding response OmpR family regulator
MTTTNGIPTRHRILVVEDQSEIRNLVIQILKEDGYEVTATSDGERAIRILEENDFDLVVLDVMMPQVDGYGVLRYIRSGGEMRSMAVLMLTALGSDRDWLKALRYGAHDYLPKPFDPQELVQRVGDLLSMNPITRARYRESGLDRSHLLAQLEISFGAA